MKSKYKILISLIFIGVFLFSLEKVYDFLLQENLNLKASYITKGKVNVDLLIEGNCTTYSTISPKILEEETKLSAYNLAQHNAGFTENYLNLYLYLKNNKAPKYLLLFVSPESFDDRYNFFTSYRFSHLMNDKVVSEIIKETDPNYYKWTMIPFFKYSYYSDEIHFNALQGFKHYYSNKHFPFLKKGNRPLEKVQTENTPFIQSYSTNPKFIWSKTKEKYLIKIIQLAKKEKIKLIFFESPMYNEDLKNQTNRADFLEKTRQISNKYKIDYLVFDTLNMSKNKSNFYSTNTLNSASSDQFTRILSGYIRANTFKIPH